MVVGPVFTIYVLGTSFMAVGPVFTIYLLGTSFVVVGSVHYLSVRYELRGTWTRRGNTW